MDEIVFRASELEVQPYTLQQVQLSAERKDDRFEVVDGTITFRQHGWFEILLTVEWDPTNVEGTRFAHTAITDRHPLHSEAINASVLAGLSGGRQLLRGNTIFEPGRVDHVSLEVWQDSNRSVQIRSASLEVRELNL